MSDNLLVATRKGLFEISKSDGSWEITSRAFVGDNVGIVSVDGANSRAYISLEHGHFGTKVHRSDDKGANWVEVSCPEYPEQPEGWVEAPNAFAGKVTPWSLESIWAIEPAPNGVVWCGTIPGGLFKSEDGGDSWAMVRSLWDIEERKQWMGGGWTTPVFIRSVSTREIPTT